MYKEGDPADCFYIIVNSGGMVELTKRIDLNQMDKGDNKEFKKFQSEYLG